MYLFVFSLFLCVMYDLPLLWVSRFMFLRFVCVFAHFAKQHMSLAHAPNMHSGVRIFTDCPEYFIFTQCHVSICNKITGTLICVCYFLIELFLLLLHDILSDGRNFCSTHRCGAIVRSSSGLPNVRETLFNFVVPKTAHLPLKHF